MGVSLILYVKCGVHKLKGRLESIWNTQHIANTGQFGFAFNLNLNNKNEAFKQHRCPFCIASGKPFVSFSFYENDRHRLIIDIRVSGAR